MEMTIEQVHNDNDDHGNEHFEDKISLQGDYDDYRDGDN